MKRIQFNEETHTYLVDGKKVPSVTDICSPITADHYGQISAVILQQASRRGTAVHEATEIIDLDGEPELDLEIEPYVQAYRDFLHDYRPDWEYVEYIGYNGDMHYCGTVDRAGTVNGKYWILDIKSTASPTRENYMATCCQTEGYALMLGKDCACERKILYLRKDGTYRLVDCLEWENKNDFDSFYLFTQLCKTRTYIDSVKERKQNGKQSNS